MSVIGGNPENIVSVLGEALPRVAW